MIKMIKIELAEWQASGSQRRGIHSGFWQKLKVINERHAHWRVADRVWKIMEHYPR